MTYEVQQTRWDRIIRRVSGSIGPGSRVSETISELFPMIDVERVPGELLAAGGTRLVWQSTERPAAVGLVTASQLQNPVDSGVIITCSTLEIMTDVATIISFQNTVTFNGFPVPGLFRDTRLGVARQTTGKVSSFNNVTTGGGIRLRVLAGVLNRFTDENSLAILSPGTALQVGTASTQIRMTVNYYWREREVLPAELHL